MIFCYGSWNRLRHIPWNNFSDEDEQISYRTRKSKNYGVFTILTLLLLLPSCLLPNRAESMSVPWHFHFTYIYSSCKNRRTKRSSTLQEAAVWDSFCSTKPKTIATHSRIQFQSQKVFLENRFNFIQIRNVLCLSPKPPSNKVIFLTNENFVASKGKHHISLMLIHQKVQNQKVSTSDLSTRRLAHSLRSKGRGGELQSPLWFEVWKSSHLLMSVNTGVICKGKWLSRARFHWARIREEQKRE